MGREAPKELREPLRSFMEGETLRLCMYLAASETADLVAGTSIAPSPCSPGTGMPPSVVFVPFWAVPAAAMSFSSKVTILTVVSIVMNKMGIKRMNEDGDELSNSLEHTRLLYVEEEEYRTVTTSRNPRWIEGLAQSLYMPGKLFAERMDGLPLFL